MKIEELEFEPATKTATKARICLTGVSGSGKTYTALMLAHALGEKVGVIDTERRTASKYVGRNGWAFATIYPTSYSPQSLVRHLGKAAEAGYDVLIVDSWSLYWSGADGMLEQVDARTAASRNNNKFASGWKDMAPEEQRSLDALLSYPGHVIVTLRVKTEYLVGTTRDGKSAPQKVGTKPIQREGFEYEFDLIGDMDLANNLTVTKSRIENIEAGMVYPKPGVELAQEIEGFLSDGVALPTPADYRHRALQANTVDDLRALYEEANGYRLAGAPMMDDHGKPTTLGDYLRSLASIIGAKETAA